MKKEDEIKKEEEIKKEDEIKKEEEERKEILEKQKKFLEIMNIERERKRDIELLKKKIEKEKLKKLEKFSKINYISNNNKFGKDGPFACHSKAMSLCEVLIMCRNSNYYTYCSKVAGLSDEKIKELYESSEMNYNFEG